MFQNLELLFVCLDVFVMWSSYTYLSLLSMVDTARFWKTGQLVNVQCLIVSNFPDLHIEFSLPAAVSINRSGLDKTDDDRRILQADFLYMVFMDHKMGTTRGLLGLSLILLLLHKFLYETVSPGDVSHTWVKWSNNDTFSIIGLLYELVSQWDGLIQEGLITLTH